MAERKKRPQIDDPSKKRAGLFGFGKQPKRSEDHDTFGKIAEAIARFMGTPAFLAGMTVFCGVWLGWNTFMPEAVQFDPRALNYTLLTLILSLQASYAAPLLLLSDNRQADRDRVQAEQDRQSNERAHATQEFMTREIASLHIAMNDVATRDYVRGEIRDLLDELKESAEAEAAGRAEEASDTNPADVEALRALLREDIRAILREELAAVRDKESAS